MKKYFLSILILIISFWSCTEKWGKDADSKSVDATFQENPNYQFKNPDQFWKLPNDLKEISGIALLNNSTMLCVQDEKGYLYLYNLSSKRIDKKIRFSFDADYEDIAILADKVFVLRSNGWIYEVNNLFTDLSTTTYKTGLSLKNNTEGLCYDSVSKKVLIARKKFPGI